MPTNMPTGQIAVIEWKTALEEQKARILGRAQRSLRDFEPAVRKWIQDVRERGDEAIWAYIQEFDSAYTPKSLRVTPEDIGIAYERIDPSLLASIKEQISISRKFHQATMACVTMEMKVETVPGLVAGYRRQPVDAAGLYVPAGKAPLPTVAQILTVAAKAAGVPRAVVCFPPTAPEAEDVIIVAANEAGADEIYRVGGIAAIAALAYGTESIAPVQKIAGPGNPWVQTAKLQMVDQVGIDMFSGPSEAVILADASANPAYLAADILARCEHGPDSAGVLITDSREVAEATVQEIEKQRPTLARQKYIAEALSTFSAIIVVDTLQEMIDLTNEYKPEHLEIQTASPQAVFAQIRHAGSTFIGPYAPVAVGDYASGTNHCLPTGSATAFSSAVNPETFMKFLQFQELTQEGLEGLKPIVEKISDAEGLDAHKRSVQIRFEGDK